MTLAPYVLPIWQINEPTWPAAPETTKISLALIFATSSRPYLAEAELVGGVLLAPMLGLRSKYAVMPPNHDHDKLCEIGRTCIERAR